MDTIQSAIMTSSLINLPHGEEEPGQQPPTLCLIPHIHSWSSGVSYQQVLFRESRGSWESFQPWDWSHSEERGIDPGLLVWSGESTAALEGSSRLIPLTGYRCRPGIRTGGLGLGLDV